MSDDSDYFVHPQRFPKNAPGPFYTLGQQSVTGAWSGMCFACTTPESEAPTLLAELNDENSDTYFVRQPQSAEEIVQACRAAAVCCTSSVRYGGKDRAIIQRLGAEHCDYGVLTDGRLRLRELTEGNAKWWQFWR